MKQNEYMAGWFSNASIAVGVSFMVSVILAVIDGKVTESNIWIFATFVLLFAGISIFFVVFGFFCLRREEKSMSPEIRYIPVASSAGIHELDRALLGSPHEPISNRVEVVIRVR
ncbi:uncharacterized membrane protein YozB (DUF420 family) [Rhizobium petrolearium]|uniref:hypothetical protein n=1 Tax=Neorhizobium petrolearium TaxID=515361 RepID=UPI001AE3EEC6|nr:hypothetical protein [Neorhizobium petrolearium]MBP1845919.1 uncharacterized membrane protein YozB (DUF420 family) [Neorhizobium petrolearium]